MAEELFWVADGKGFVCCSSVNVAVVETKEQARAAAAEARVQGFITEDELFSVLEAIRNSDLPDKNERQGFRLATLQELIDEGHLRIQQNNETFK